MRSKVKMNPGSLNRRRPTTEIQNDPPNPVEFDTDDDRTVHFRPYSGYVHLYRFQAIISGLVTILLVLTYFWVKFFVREKAPYVHKRPLDDISRINLNASSNIVEHIEAQMDTESLDVPAVVRFAAWSASKVDFAVSGNRVRIGDAMRPEKPYSAIEHVDFRAFESHRPLSLPSLDIFVSISTDCCSNEAKQRRSAIRKSWKTIATDYNVTVLFFIGQMSPSTWNPISLRQLEYEAFTHNDLVVVRGPDGQEHMGNKTLGILQYYLSSPRSFSHLVKVNDDVYVRIPRVIGALIGPSGIRSNALYMGHAKVHYGEREDEENMYRYRRDRPSIRKGPAGAIQGTKYARGWGFILSYDVVVKIMKKVEDWDTGKDRHPIWHRNLKHMDGPMIGGYLMGSVKLSNNTDFKAAWQRCTPESIMVHLEIDAPLMTQVLYQVEINRVWDRKSVLCRSGYFIVDEFKSWYDWRNLQMDEAVTVI